MILCVFCYDVLSCVADVTTFADCTLQRSVCNCKKTLLLLSTPTFSRLDVETPSRGCDCSIRQRRVSRAQRRGQHVTNAARGRRLGLPSTPSRQGRCSGKLKANFLTHESQIFVPKTISGAARTCPEDLEAIALSVCRDLHGQA